MTDHWPVFIDELRDQVHTLRDDEHRLSSRVQTLWTTFDRFRPQGTDMSRLRFF